jgi:hypothetical protein
MGIQAGCVRVACLLSVACLRCLKVQCPNSSQGLTRLLADNAPEAMKEQKFENYFGRKIAVDASMHIYSFLVRGQRAFPG